MTVGNWPTFAPALTDGLSIHALDSNCDRTRAIKNRNIARHFAENNDAGQRDTAAPIVDHEVIGPQSPMVGSKGSPSMDKTVSVAADLTQRLCEEFGILVSRQTLGRELHAMGFRKLSARPRDYA